ncbi:DNA-methyltransferase Dcm [Deinococcus peraridilitoris DSM 19664]|uniref:DNA (cytosine-5-)-methyltransferase n=1 Tax=Deinococcus peraridilitoris (strain DSM 19664 / LMG 22246 / CIP 109416 / KR-200) TaxID=937777 RepID=L0A2E7_DEIPD|nr:DNA-methyltransferase Dcm [Deinococcus peraridilitoris DSM 19664]
MPTPRRTPRHRSAIANTTVVDVFCGVGGVTHGFVREGFRVAAGLDVDTSCRYAYETNNPGSVFVAKSVDELDVADTLRAFYPAGHTKVLVGCAPCQPFSSNNTKGKQNGDWKLLSVFCDLVARVEPDVVSMENVTRLATFHGGEVFEGFLNRLESLGYHVAWRDVNCPDYGIPQNRKRLLLLASRLGPIEFLPPTHTPETYRTVREVLSELPPLKAGQRHEADPLHWAAGLTERNLQRIRASRPDGTWRDWDETLVADCHRKSTGKSFPSVYGRMSWDRPSPTITTQFYGFGNGRFGHPEQDRAISLREGALLQTFPRTYQFVPPNGRWTFENLGRHIGNAVPVDLARVVAKSVAVHLASQASPVAG